MCAFTQCLARILLFNVDLTAVEVLRGEPASHRTWFVFPSRERTRMIVALVFAHVWGVLQLIALASLTRTVRVRTVLMALAVGLYVCAPLAVVCSVLPAGEHMAKRSTSKRELINPAKNKMFAKRRAKGKFQGNGRRWSVARRGSPQGRQEDSEVWVRGSGGP
jgi:hypothetical protein